MIPILFFLKVYLKAKRFFIGSPIWTAFFRPAEDMPSRIAYLKTFRELLGKAE